MFWVDIVKNGFSQSGHGTWNLTVSQEWIDMEGTDFLHAGANLGKLKVI